MQLSYTSAEGQASACKNNIFSWKLWVVFFLMACLSAQEKVRAWATKSQPLSTKVANAQVAPSRALSAAPSASPSHPGEGLPALQRKASGL